MGVVAWSKRKSWNVKDTIENCVKYFYYNEYESEEEGKGTRESLSYIDFLDINNNTIRSDFYGIDSTIEFSSYSIYDGRKLIKDSTENSYNTYI